MDDRVVDLEIKIAFLERHLQELDGVVRKVCDDLALLRKEVAALSAPPEEKQSLDAEKPPHY